MSNCTASANGIIAINPKNLKYSVLIVLYMKDTNSVQNKYLLSISHHTEDILLQRKITLQGSLSGEQWPCFCVELSNNRPYWCMGYCPAMIYNGFRLGHHSYAMIFNHIRRFVSERILDRMNFKVRWHGEGY